ALKYFSFENTAALVDITPSVLSRICGVIIVRHYDEELEIGLKIKLTAQQLITPEYVRAIPSASSFSHDRNSSERYQIEFSQKCVDLLIKYKQQFPLVFELLDTTTEFNNQSLCFVLKNNHNILKRCLNVLFFGFSFFFKKKNCFYVFLPPPSPFKKKKKTSLADVPEKDSKKLDVSEEKSGPSLHSQDNGRTDTRKEDSQKSTHTEETKRQNHEKHTKLKPPSGNHPKKKSKKTMARREDTEVVSDSEPDETLSISHSSASPSPSPNDEEKEKKKQLKQIQQAEGFQYLVGIVKWLKQQEIAQLPLIEMDAVVLEKDTIFAVQNTADHYYKEQMQKQPRRVKLLKAAMADVYPSDPNIAWSPSSGNQNYRLGDRVCSLRSDFGIPFGALGTVVGIHRDFLEVITDRVVASGTTLHNRCSDNRGDNTFIFFFCHCIKFPTIISFHMQNKIHNLQFFLKQEISLYANNCYSICFIKLCYLSKTNQ
ncbi:hypothetical protein RFI_34138, partial [Reticulomyxa filosa]